jgi:hypothetical protein
VDYVCDCHDGEEGFDCDELQRVLADADQELQQDCVVELDELQAKDQAEGLECGIDTGI